MKMFCYKCFNDIIGKPATLQRYREEDNTSETLVFCCAKCRNAFVLQMMQDTSDEKWLEDKKYMDPASCEECGYFADCVGHFLYCPFTRESTTEKRQRELIENGSKSKTTQQLRTKARVRLAQTKGV